MALEVKIIMFWLPIIFPMCKLEGGYVCNWGATRLLRAICPVCGCREVVKGGGWCVVSVMCGRDDWYGL